MRRVQLARRAYAHFGHPASRPENPGVGGSIPSLPTIAESSCTADAPAAQTKADSDAASLREPGAGLQARIGLTQVDEGRTGRSLA